MFAVASWLAICLVDMHHSSSRFSHLLELGCQSLAPSWVGAEVLGTSSLQVEGG